MGGPAIFRSLSANHRRLARHLDADRRQGKGVVVREWSVSVEGGLAHVAERILEWCKEAMAASRRPYGVDHFDLVLALRSSERMSKLSFGRLRAVELYGEALPARIVVALQQELRAPGEQFVHVAAGFFSWGDALHRALLATEQASPT